MGRPKKNEGEAKEPKGEQEQKSKGSAYIVTAPFRDLNDYSIFYEVGDDVSHLDPARLERLVDLKLVEIQ